MKSESAYFRIIQFILLCLIAISAHAFDGNIVITHHDNQSLNPETGSVLFITTEPYGARVLVDNSPIKGRTPLVIRESQIGERNLRIEKSGYEPLEVVADVGNGEIVVVEGTLSPTGISLFFQDGIAEGADGEALPPGGYSFNPGYYSLGNSDGVGTIAPVYTNQKWIDALNIAIPFVSVLTGGLVISETVSPRSEASISPFTVGVLVSDILMIGANIGLHVHRTGWRKEWEVDSASVRPHSAEDDYKNAEEALAAGNWSKAQKLFDRYHLVYPLDRNSPTALYRSARLSFLQGDNTGCAKRLDRMKSEYPTPEYWDRIWQLSADTAFRDGRVEDGLKALDMILGLDDMVNMESVAQQKATVLTEAVELGGAVEP